MASKPQDFIKNLTGLILCGAILYGCVAIYRVSENLPAEPAAPDTKSSDDPGDDAVAALFKLTDQQSARFLLPCDQGDKICADNQQSFKGTYLAALTDYAPSQADVARYLVPWSNHPGIKPDQIEACAWAVLSSRGKASDLMDRSCLTNSNVESLHAAKARVIEIQTLMHTPLTKTP